MNSKHVISKTILAIFVWSFFWFFGQILMKIDLPFIAEIDNVNIGFLIFSIWNLLVTAIAFVIWRVKFNDFKFLKIKDKRVLFLYIVPIVLAILAFIDSSRYGVNSYLWVFGLVATTFLAQDMLTFGFLQTYLGKIMKPVYAFLITSSAFFLAHLAYNFSAMTLILLSGAFLFGFLRYKTKNIYIINIIHNIISLV